MVQVAIFGAFLVMGSLASDTATCTTAATTTPMRTTPANVVIDQMDLLDIKLHLIKQRLYPFVAAPATPKPAGKECKTQAFDSTPKGKYDYRESCCVRHPLS